MKKQDVVKDILVAIKSVKARAKAAEAAGDQMRLYVLMGDLYALQAVLAAEVEILMENNKAA